MCTATLTWDQMDGKQLETALREIVSTSESEEQIRSRIRDELECESEPSISFRIPEDSTDHHACAISRALGNLISANGAMVMLLIYDRRGNILSL